MEVCSRLQAALLEDRQQAVARRPRVCGRLEDDEVARAEALRDVGTRRAEDAEVRLALRRGLNSSTPTSRRSPTQTMLAGLFAPPNVSSDRAVAAPPMPLAFMP